MLKPFTVVAALFSSVVFSSAVIAHTLALPHSHDGTGIPVNQGLIFGVIVLGLACLALVCSMKKMR